MTGTGITASYNSSTHILTLSGSDTLAQSLSITIVNQAPVLNGVNLDVREGEIVALVGANGAGKTTTLRAVSGLLPALAGEVLFEGERLTGQTPSRIVERGIGHVPEGRQLFTNMTVDENLTMGAYLPRAKATLSENRDWVVSLFPRLAERPHQLAGTLSGGEQQMLAIGRALMARPRLLLLDEPSLGLAPLVVKEIFALFVVILALHALINIFSHRLIALFTSVSVWWHVTWTLIILGILIIVVTDGAVTVVPGALTAAGFQRRDAGQRCECGVAADPAAVPCGPCHGYLHRRRRRRQSRETGARPGPGRFGDARRRRSPPVRGNR